LLPSDHERALTRAIVLAGDKVGVPVVDHLIVEASDTFSFKKAGLL